MTNFNITIVSDTVCPWCYVGKKRLESAITSWKQAHPNDTFSTTFKAYQLNPDAPTTGFDKQTYYNNRFGPQRTAMMFRRLTEVGKSVGIDFKFGGRTGNTRDSHRLIELAKSKGEAVQNKVVEKLNEAYFEKEGDITSHDVLLKAGVEAGLDEKEAKEWLESGKGGKEVDEEVGLAERQFITGVPYFTVNGRFHVEGAQEPEAFVDVFERVSSLKRDVGDAGLKGQSY